MCLFWMKKVSGDQREFTFTKLSLHLTQGIIFFINVFYSMLKAFYHFNDQVDFKINFGLKGLNAHTLVVYIYW